jgi:CxxC motif-containing protein (DUF1111 family)
MHDGRAKTLEDAIVMHGGQAARAAQRFQALTDEEQKRCIAFLKALRAPQSSRVAQGRSNKGL